MNRLKEVCLQVIGSLVAIVGAFLFVVILLPIINPGAWKLHAAGNHTFLFYVLWYGIGFAVSVTLMWLGYVISSHAKRK